MAQATMDIFGFLPSSVRRELSLSVQVRNVCVTCCLQHSGLTAAGPRTLDCVEARRQVRHLRLHEFLRSKGCAIPSSQDHMIRVCVLCQHGLETCSACTLASLAKTSEAMPRKVTQDDSKRKEKEKEKELIEFGLNLTILAERSSAKHERNTHCH